MKDILHKTKKGEALDSVDYKRLLVYLGIKRSVNVILLIILLTLIAISAILIQIMLENFIHILITLAIYLVLVISVHYSPKDYLYNLQLYLKALDEFYDEKFAPYYGYYVFRTSNIVVPEKAAKNPNIFFLSNGYEFIIYEDFLKNTSIELKGISANEHEYHILRVINENTVNNKPLIFKPEEISSYFEVVEARFQANVDYGYKNHTLKFPLSEYKNYVEILLVDNSILRLGRSVLDVLRTYLPTKEIRRPR